MDAAKEHREHLGHISYRSKWCRLCREEAKAERKAEELEKVRELHGRMADAFERSEQNVKR